MKGVLSRIKRAHSRHGAAHLAKNALPYLHNLARPYLPKRESDFNGVSVLEGRYFDTINPNRDKPDRPKYESAMCAGVRKYVSEGDAVIVIGGGRGVTTTIAARRVGDGGSVHVYEASLEFLPRIKDTLRRNSVEDRVRVHASAVGEVVEIYGEEMVSTTLPPSDLPKCDVMVMDCEGTEKQILREMTMRPRAIVVETHGTLDSPTHEIRKILEKRGYTIQDASLAMAESPDHSRKNDIWVLTAVRSGTL